MMYSNYEGISMEIKNYSAERKKEWDNFLETSKSPVFLFKRDYMEYHRDRFKDKSLMFYDDGKLIAILPANVDKKEIVSHGGLTFGGYNHVVIGEVAA